MQRGGERQGGRAARRRAAASVAVGTAAGVAPHCVCVRPPCHVDGCAFGGLWPCLPKGLCGMLSVGMHARFWERRAAITLFEPSGRKQ
eukprot:357838-Chlamydomonas_euryale.AAC.14